MKIRIKTYNGELPSYLTAGKVYEVIQVTTKGNISIRNDLKSVLWIRELGCDQLNGGSWEVESD